MLCWPEGPSRRVELGCDPSEFPSLGFSLALGLIPAREGDSQQQLCHQSPVNAVIWGEEGKRAGKDGKSTSGIHGSPKNIPLVPEGLCCQLRAQELALKTLALCKN